MTTQTRSDALSTVLEKIALIGPALRERALEAETAGRLSDETIADLHATGAFDIGSPAELGGLELSVREQMEVVAAVSAWDGSCGWVVWAGASTNWIPAGSGRRVVEEVYGPAWVGPRVAGSSHFPSSRGRAVRGDDGWVVSGGPWGFATDSLWSPFTNLGCIADDGDGPYLVGVQVPREELRFLDDWRVAGMKGTGSVSVELADGELHVPDHRVVAFRDVQSRALDNGLAGSLWQVPSLGWAFSTMAAMSIGMAEGALERFLERSDGRPIRGTTYKNQLEAPLTHLMLAEVHAKVRSARLTAQANAEETDRMGEMAAAGVPVAPEQMQEFSARVLLETAYAAKWCSEAIELVQRNSGSTAIREDEPIQRAWRDARVIALHGALNLEALSENYGRLMAGTQAHQVEGITATDRFAPAPTRAPAAPDTMAAPVTTAREKVAV